MGAALHMSLLISVVVAAAPGLARAADREAERLAEAAVALCARADRLAADERPALLRRGLRLAERALARDQAVARAHFAVFCTLGKLVDSEGLGWRTLGSVRRVRTAIERAVTLAPDDVDALVGKGALLLRLPRLLGGDPEEAYGCLQRALEIDPWHRGGRHYLAQVRPDRIAPGPTALSSAYGAE
jgi:tetratricopeptide (TPR) repeat protein